MLCCGINNLAFAFGTTDGNQMRVRMVEYTPGYIADRGCQKGHVLFCLEGEMSIEKIPVP